MSQLSPIVHPVISSALSLLKKLLSPIFNASHNEKVNQLDSRLLEWVILYVSNMLDNFMERTHDTYMKSLGKIIVYLR